MRLDDITPVLLTFNEEANIGRALAQLDWAKDIVVLDSHSTDHTVEIVRHHPKVRLFTRTFDHHSIQWGYAIAETGVATEWVFALEPDLIVPPALLREIEALVPPDDVAGYESPFRICVYGTPLPRSIYPPRVLLSRRLLTSFARDGHAHRVVIAGRVLPLRVPLDHDDWKPITEWVVAQDRYARAECDKQIAAAPGALSLPDRVRALGFAAPLAVLFYCLFVKRLIFAGRAGWFYTYQRVAAEILLSLYLIEARLSGRGEKR